MAWVLKQKVGDHVAKHVLMCLANYAGEDGENAFPSVSRLERDTELSERTIREKLSWLLDQGFIKYGDQAISAAYAKQKNHITTCYDFVFRGAPAAPVEKEGCAPRSLGVQETAVRGAPAAPNPSYNRKRSVSADAPPQSGGAAPKKGPPLVEEVFRERESVKGRQPDFASEFRARFGTDPP